MPHFDNTRDIPYFKKLLKRENNNFNYNWMAEDKLKIVEIIEAIRAATKEGIEEDWLEVRQDAFTDWND